MVAISATTNIKRKNKKPFLCKIMVPPFLTRACSFVPPNPTLNTLLTRHRFLLISSHVSIQPELITGSREICSLSKNCSIWMSTSRTRIFSKKPYSRCLPLWGPLILVPQLGPNSNGTKSLLLKRPR